MAGSIEDLGRRTADVAVQLLNGATPTSINVPPELPGRLAALLIAHSCRINSLFAPCDPGAAPGIRY